MTDIEPAAMATPIPAVGVICWRGEELLVVQRARPPRAGRWSLPGGRIRPGETAARAALRELREETAVTARLVGLVDVVDLIQPATAQDRAFHFVVIEFAALWLEGDVAAGDDAADAAFMPVGAALGVIADPATERVVRAASALIQREGHT